MIGDDRTFLERAVESLEGARSELARQRFHNCANRCYYACFQAAIHALVMHGFRPTRGDWGHDFVESQFVGQLINRRHLYDATLRTVLEQNRDLRVTADYRRERVTEVRVSRALQRAERFVDAIVRRQESQT
ncbi:MAG TPA: HEPN domain-containing protein [Chloroflexota bacterium]|nr:HEPN domain-containing protein [Chloroflexota bacterium]